MGDDSLSQLHLILCDRILIPPEHRANWRTSHYFILFKPSSLTHTQYNSIQFIESEVQRRRNRIYLPSIKPWTARMEQIRLRSEVSIQTYTHNRSRFKINPSIKSEISSLIYWWISCETILAHWTMSHRRERKRLGNFLRENLICKLKDERNVVDELEKRFSK